MDINASCPPLPLDERSVPLLLFMGYLVSTSTASFTPCRATGVAKGARSMCIPKDSSSAAQAAIKCMQKKKRIKKRKSPGRGRGGSPLWASRISG
jgi:hypothetical protein